MKAKFIYLIFLFFTLLSCKKTEDRNCFKTAGEKVEFIVQTDAFYELLLGQRLNYTLVSDSVNYVKIIGGKNLVKSIRCEVINGILYLENNNRCNFFRSFADIIELEIHYTNLNRVEGAVSHNLIALDTIRGEYFNLELRGASGYADIVVNTNFLNGFANDGNSDYKYSGKTNYAHIQVHSYGTADVRSLEVAQQLEITTNSVRSVYCVANNIPLIVNILGIGDVFYSGNPSSIEVNGHGSGKLIYVD